MGIVEVLSSSHLRFFHPAITMKSMESCVLLFFAVFIFAAAAAAEEEAEFLPGLEPEEIMKAELQPEDVSDKGMAETMVEASGGKSNFQLDMKMDSLQMALSYNPKLTTGFAGAAIIGQYYRWPKRITPYRIERSIEKTSHIYSAMKEWMDQTCIVFKPASSSVAREVGHNHAATIFSEDGCYSPVGYQHGGFQKISLANGGCAYHATALHELGHTIGLHHEQCRQDRDGYIDIQWKNIQEDNKYNFEKAAGTNNMGVKYDYCSIMHYEGDAFSSNGEITMLTKDPDYQFTIGAQKFLSFTDAKIVNKMYNCNSHCGSASWCKDPCYVNHKCTCMCPNKCEKRPCNDYPPKDSQNPNYCKHAECTGKFRWWYRKVCARTCGLCDELRRRG